MHLLTLIVGIVFLHEAYTLKCYECLPDITGTCIDTAIDCPSPRSQCGVERSLTYVGGSKESDISTKSCTLPEECLTGSVNIGVARTVLASSCCSSDLCNTQPVPDPGQNNPNGKKCFTCDLHTNQCTATLNCLGTEDSCFSATVAVEGEKFTLKGCVTKQLCASVKNPYVAAKTGSEINCCQGDYCNSASSTSSGLLVLVAPLIYFITFS